MNRREFGIGASQLAMLGAFVPGASFAQDVTSGSSDEPWYQTLKRIVQINFTERDAGRFNVDQWIDYLVSTRTQCTFVSITNIVGFYPTELEDLPRSRWLGDNDLVGDCARAAKAAGIRILGRPSPDMAQTTLVEDHPEWFRRDENGNLLPVVTSFSSGAPDDPSSAPGFARTCSMTSYFDEFLPKMIDEVMDRYDLDGIFTNGWPGNGIPRCYCETCQAIAPPGSEEYRIAYQARIEYLWGLLSEHTRRRRDDAVFIGNIGGRIAGSELDVQSLLSRGVWMFADQQGRHGRYEPSWDAGMQTRVSRAVVPGKQAVVSTGAWTLLSPTGWRSVSGNEHEIQTRLHQTLAAGGIMHYHWPGFDQGFREDRRWQDYGRDVLTWQAENDAHFQNKRSLAKVAMLVSPASARVYEVPPGTGEDDCYNGLYRVLNEQRVPFDVILDGQLTEEGLAPYTALVMSNIGVLTDAQEDAIRAFVARGGSVMATFETGMYDVEGNLRETPALDDLFGMTRTGPRHGFGADGSNGTRFMPGAVSMQRIERGDHPILEAFENTNWIAGSSWRMPMVIEGEPLLTDIPQHSVYPVESIFPDPEQTDTPTIAVREQGNARLVYIAEDVDGGYWRTSERDLGELLAGSLRWMLNGDVPAKVEGTGLLETYLWETEPGYALHLVNHTNPNFRGGHLRELYPVGPFRVTLDIGSSTPIRSARLLKAGTDLPFRQTGSQIELIVPSVESYEVAALMV